MIRVVLLDWVIEGLQLSPVARLLQGRADDDEVWQCCWCCSAVVVFGAGFGCPVDQVDGDGTRPGGDGQGRHGRVGVGGDVFDAARQATLAGRLR